MKGLLLKDWYAIMSYCRVNLLILAVFSVLSGISIMKGGSIYYTYYYAYYPCILASITAVGLISYEEKEKWESYAAALPYTKAQMVSSKYIVSLCLGAATVLLNIIAQLVFMAVRNTYELGSFVSFLFVLVPFALLPAAFILPFIYKFGMNKGRIAYLIVLGFSFGVITLLSSKQTMGLPENMSFSPMNTGVLLLAVSLVVYAFSWALSIHFYRNREI